MTEGHKADNGDWIPGKEIIGDPIPCRYELSNKANTITLPDGQAFSYSLVVYLDLSDIDYPFGTTVRIFDKLGKQVFVKQIQGFHRGQLNMRIWL